MRFAGGLTAGTRCTERQALRASWTRDTVRLAAAEVTTLGLVNTNQATLAQQLDEALGPLGVIRASPFAFGPSSITWDLTVNRYGVGLTAAQLASALDGANPYLRLQVLETRVVKSGETTREEDRAKLDTEVVAVAAAERNPLQQFLDGLKGFGLTVGVLAVVGLGVYAYFRSKGAK